MPLTWNAILLGRGSDRDTDESTLRTESSFSGVTVGSADAPLSDRIHSFTIDDLDGDNIWDRDNERAPETSSLSKNGITEQVQLDSVIVYESTITYDDGSTAQITAVTIQLTDGRVFLAPEYLDNADNAALNAKPIQSVSLGRVSSNQTNLVADRQAGNFAPCFGRGTAIETPRGPVPIEDLRAGDTVMTADAGVQRIRWIGMSRTEGTDTMAPVEFTRGALGTTRRLCVSPQHRMLVTGWRAELLFGESEVLVPAKALVNGQDIRRVERPTVDYFHMMFDRHQIVFAHGIPSESFHPGEYSVGQMEDEARKEILSLFNELELVPGSYGKDARTAPRLRESALLRD